MIIELLGFLGEGIVLALMSLSPSKIVRKIAYDIPVRAPYANIRRKILFTVLDFAVLILILCLIAFASGRII